MAPAVRCARALRDGHRCSNGAPAVRTLRALCALRPAIGGSTRPLLGLPRRGCAPVCAIAVRRAWRRCLLIIMKRGQGWTKLRILGVARTSALSHEKRHTRQEGAFALRWLYTRARCTRNMRHITKASHALCDGSKCETGGRRGQRDGLEPSCADNGRAVRKAYVRDTPGQEASEKGRPEYIQRRSYEQPRGPPSRRAVNLRAGARARRRFFRTPKFHSAARPAPCARAGSLTRPRRRSYACR